MHITSAKLLAVPTLMSHVQICTALVEFKPDTSLINLLLSLSNVHAFNQTQLRKFQKRSCYLSQNVIQHKVWYIILKWCSLQKNIALHNLPGSSKIFVDFIINFENTERQVLKEKQYALSYNIIRCIVVTILK